MLYSWVSRPSCWVQKETLSEQTKMTNSCRVGSAVQSPSTSAHSTFTCVASMPRNQPVREQHWNCGCSGCIMSRCSRSLIGWSSSRPVTQAKIESTEATARESLARLSTALTAHRATVATVECFHNRHHFSVPYCPLPHLSAFIFSNFGPNLKNFS